MARKIKFTVLFLIAAGVMALALYAQPPERVNAQQPTGSVPTVTGTPQGAYIVVDPSLEQVELYAGPSSYFYPKIGLLLAGQQAPALAYSEDKQWIKIRYLGVPNSEAWIYALYVSLFRGVDLATVPAPPTPTLVSTPTLELTLAAAFVGQQTPTRLPTFTQPAPLVIPTFVDQTTRPSRVPMGLLILGFSFIGSLGALISYLRGR